MKRFQFRLQSVLEHRERKENIAQMNFGEAQTQLNRALIMLQELEEVRDAIIGELSERRLSSSFDPVESKLYHDYLKTIKQCIIDQNAYVADLTSTAEALRLHLVGASQERQVLDKMKTKAKTAHQDDANKHEQTVSDDISSSRRRFQQVSQE